MLQYGKCDVAMYSCRVQTITDLRKPYAHTCKEQQRTHCML